MKIANSQPILLTSAFNMLTNTDILTGRLFLRTQTYMQSEI